MLDNDGLGLHGMPMGPYDQDLKSVGPVAQNHHISPPSNCELNLPNGSAYRRGCSQQTRIKAVVTL